MALAQKLVPLADRLRGLPGRFGTRAYTVTIRVRSWTGERPGVAGSAYSDFDTPIVNTITMPGGRTIKVPPRVDLLTAKDVIASGGLYVDRDFRVGPLSPAYAQGGVMRSTIDPNPFNAATEIFWFLTGPDMPDRGVAYRRVYEEATALHWYVHLRSMGKFP